VVVERRGHGTQRVQLQRSGGRGTFEGVLTRPPVGQYRVWVAIPVIPGRAPAADFSVAAPPGEFERVQTDASAMQRAAKQTKGRYYTFQTARRLVSDLPRGRQVPIGLATREPIWNKWPVLLVLLTLLIAEWILRKLGGMV
jgi:hypothetical protein